MGGGFPETSNFSGRPVRCFSGTVVFGATSVSSPFSGGLAFGATPAGF